jgi:hypothetical protein
MMEDAVDRSEAVSRGRWRKSAEACIYSFHNVVWMFKCLVVWWLDVYIHSLVWCTYAVR